MGAGVTERRKGWADAVAWWWWRLSRVTKRLDAWAGRHFVESAGGAIQREAGAARRESDSLERERSMLWEIKLADSTDALQAVCDMRLREIDKHFE